MEKKNHPCYRLYFWDYWDSRITNIYQRLQSAFVWFLADLCAQHSLPRSLVQAVPARGKCNCCSCSGAAAVLLHWSELVEGSASKQRCRGASSSESVLSSGSVTALTGQTDALRRWSNSHTSLFLLDRIVYIVLGWVGVWQLVWCFLLTLSEMLRVPHLHVAGVGGAAPMWLIVTILFGRVGEAMTAWQRPSVWSRWSSFCLFESRGSNLTRFPLMVHCLTILDSELRQLDTKSVLQSWEYFLTVNTTDCCPLPSPLYFPVKYNPTYTYTQPYNSAQPLD